MQNANVYGTYVWRNVSVAIATYCTERRRHRDTERQRGSAVAQRDRETERQRDRAILQRRYDATGEEPLAVTVQH